MSYHYSKILLKISKSIILLFEEYSLNLDRWALSEVPCLKQRWPLVLRTQASLSDNLPTNTYVGVPQLVK